MLRSGRQATAWASRQRFNTLPQYTIRYGFRTNRHIPWNQSQSVRRPASWAISGAGILWLGFLLGGRTKNEDEDPRDIKALSKVSFDKLLSGWM